MDKTSYRVLTLTVSCMLLLSTTAQQVIAWPCLGGCPDCETCTPTGCECQADCGCGGRTCPDEVHYSCVECECICDADPYYTQDTVITPVSITSPSDGDVFCIGSNINVSCSTSTDSDIYHHCVDNVWTEEPVGDPVTHTWSGSGTFDPATGTSSTFTPSSSAGSKTITITASDSPKYNDTDPTDSITAHVIDGLTVFPREAYVCVTCTKDFYAWACVGGVSQNVTAESTFSTSNVSFNGNTLTAGPTPSTSEGSDWVRATYQGNTTDADHDCDLTVFNVNITTPTSTAMDITTAPAMPSATFHADIEPEDILSKTTFKWYLQISFTQHGRSDQHRVPTSGTQDVQGNENWTPDWSCLSPNPVGGDLHVYVTASVSGASSEDEDDQSGYEIKGTNPSKATVKSGCSIQEQVVIYKESSPKWCQFSPTPVGWPIFGPPNGWGLMQLDPPPSELVIWSWTGNRTAGCGVLSDKYSWGLGYPQRLRNKYGGNPNIRDWNSDEERWKDGYQLYNGGHAWRFHFDDPDNKNTSNGYWEPNPDCSGYGIDAWNIQQDVEGGNPPSGW